MIRQLHCTSLRLLCVLWALPVLLHAYPARAQSGPPARTVKLQSDPPTAAQTDFKLRPADGIDIGLLVGSGIASAVIHFGATPNTSAVIGPTFDSTYPKATLDPMYRDQIGKSHKDNTVPEWAPAVGGGLLLGALLIDGLYVRKRSHGTEVRQLYDVLFGFVDATVLTFLTVESLKTGFGRLRPDFQDRLRIAEQCKDRPDTGACLGYAGDTPSQVAKEGRLSFPSGHTAFSFAFANYTALAIGGRYVWGKDATKPSQALGALTQAGLLGLATWVGASRVDDHWHNSSDVVAGMAIGMLWSNVAYWRRFDLKGQPRRAIKSSFTLSPVPGPGDVGAALIGHF
jgi:membrane-associated phospholipid phosphatase